MDSVWTTGMWPLQSSRVKSNKEIVEIIYIMVVGLMNAENLMKKIVPLISIGWAERKRDFYR
jgi:hypothetical protein